MVKTLANIGAEGKTLIVMPEVNENELTVVAIDGFRLAYAKKKIIDVRSV